MKIMSIIQILLFIALCGSGFYMFFKSAKQIYSNIMLGRPEKINTSLSFRIKQMCMIALGQKKMFKLTVPAILHLFIYVAFIITQIELLEIFLDGFTGHHRIIYHAIEGTFLTSIYHFTISFIEILSVLALIATVSFLYRRNILKLPRFTKPELIGWPQKDANQILIFELLLIFCIFSMNMGDRALQLKGISEGSVIGHYADTGGFLISGTLAPLFKSLPNIVLIIWERIGWWGHIIMVFVFLNYLPKSKHLHILLAFPNTFFSRPEPKGEIHNMPEIMNEVKSMIDPSFVAPATEGELKLGVKDITDLSWKSLLDAYTCTECGRCTASCPANITGKKLSPRKIMMDTRDRMEEVGRNIAENGTFKDDGKSLLGDYITKEEIRACTTCNACVEECPVNISPLNIIVELRRNMIMDQADSPTEWNNIFTNLENNQAPWQFSPEDRLKWVEELN